MEPIQELKETCEKIGRAFEEFKSENNKLIAKGVKDALAEAKLDKLNQAIDDLTGKREDLEKRVKADAELVAQLQRSVAELKATGGDRAKDEAEAKALLDWNTQIKLIASERKRDTPEAQTLDQYRAYRKAQEKMLRHGADSLTAEERKDMFVGTDVEGGFFVNPDISGRIVTKVFDLSPIRSIANVQSIGSDALEGIEDLQEADAGWVGELGARSDTNTPQIGKYRIEAHEMYAQPRTSQKLLDDASVDIESWLAMKVADKFARLEGAAFTTGNGVGRPRGFASYTTATTGDASRSWGQLQHVVTGANGGYHTTGADPLFTLLGEFKPHFLNNGKWVTRREVIAATRKLKGSDNNYLWQPGLSQGAPATLLGYPIVMAEDLPALSTNGLSMAFGDFNAGYQVVDRLGVRTLRDPYTSKPYIRFYTIRRTGGAVVNFEAIKFIKFST